MSIMQTDHVYEVVSDQPFGYLGASNESIELEVGELIVTAEDTKRPIRATGLAPNSLAVILSFIVETADEQVTTGYLVTDIDKGVATLVPGDTIEDDPKTWVTPRLQFLIEELEPSEFAAFTLPNLAAYVLSKAD